jgi:thiamine biosynthesis protein ThiS
MEIKINGETRDLTGVSTLAGLLDQLNIPNQNLAIEHNGAFIEDNADLDAVPVTEGDTLEIVRFVGGG